jgi:uncharacterized protein YdhG (YjbR/CyaY superfamily)
MRDAAPQIRDAAAQAGDAAPQVGAAVEDGDPGLSAGDDDDASPVRPKPDARRLAAIGVTTGLSVALLFGRRRQGFHNDRVTDVDGYISGYPEDVRVRLEEIRRRILAAVPGCGEAITYKMPTITLDGSSLVHFAAWKHHTALYSIPAGDGDFERAIAPYRGDKDAAKFPHAEPVPYDLVVRLVQLLAARRVSPPPTR